MEKKSLSLVIGGALCLLGYAALAVNALGLSRQHESLILGSLVAITVGMALRAIDAVAPFVREM